MAARAGGAARYALKVVDLTTPGSGPAAVDLEDDWQRGHLPGRFRDFVYPDRKS
jgi:hypothetical protein